MQCWSAFGTQLTTILSVPQEVFLLQHRVLKEYGKFAVGPDFVHAFPSFIVIAALFIFTKRELNLVHLKVTSKIVRKIIQISVNWIIISAGLWYWLIFQRIIYCLMWSYWNEENEMRPVGYPWWEKVWQSYYPPPVSPPIISSNFISWIFSTSVSLVLLHSSLYTGNWKLKVTTWLVLIKNGLTLNYTKLTKIRYKQTDNKIAKDSNAPITIDTDKYDTSSFCEECVSNMSHECGNELEISPISYGTNWMNQKMFHTNFLRKSH